MKFAAYFALGTGLAASVALFVMKLRAAAKAGKTSGRDRLALVCLPLFALLMAFNIVLVTLYF